MITHSRFILDGSLTALDYTGVVEVFFKENGFIQKGFGEPGGWDGINPSIHQGFSRRMRSELFNNGPVLHLGTTFESISTGKTIRLSCVGKSVDESLLDSSTGVECVSVTFDAILDDKYLERMFDSYSRSNFYSHQEFEERLNEGCFYYFLMKNLFFALDAKWAMGVIDKYFSGSWDPEIHHPSFLFSKVESEARKNPLFE